MRYVPIEFSKVDHQTPTTIGLRHNQCWRAPLRCDWLHDALFHKLLNQLPARRNLGGAPSIRVSPNWLHSAEVEINLDSMDGAKLVIE